MTDSETKAKRICKDFEQMRSDRATYESVWKDIRQYVRPNTVDFNARQSPGDIRTERMYDGAAMQANTDLAGDIFSDLFNPVERTFGIGTTGNVELNRDPEVIEWCDYVADSIFASYSDERSQLTSSGHELIQDVTAFGNGILSQEWDADEQQIIFMARPLAVCYYRTNKNGLVDTLARIEEQMELRQILQKFPGTTWEKIEDDLKANKKFDVIQMVQPRVDAERIYSRSDGPNMPFSSCYVLKEKQLILEESGYMSFPYHCPRWNKMADETYGRGPAHNCLPGIRMLNRMKQTVIRASQKATDPTTWLPNEGIRLPYRDHPGAVNHYNPSDFPNGFDLHQNEHKGNFPVSHEMMEAERLEIRKAFYTDWLEWFPKVERQTAEEIRSLNMRKLKKMAPLLGRLQTELLVPMIQRSFQLLDARGLIPPRPRVLLGQRMGIVYESASSRAQAAFQAESLIGFLQEIVPMAQIDPTAMDAIDMEKFIQELAYKQRIPRRVLRSPEDLAQLKEDRAQKEQAAAIAGAAEPVSKALLNVAQAREAGGIAA